MLMALRPVGCLSGPFSMPGQVWTQAPQPVQSSGATWTVNFLPANSLPLALMLRNSAGAPCSSFGSYALIRIVACGQTNEHMPHWRHSSGCQIGTLTAMLRFSYWVVPTGNRPSTGNLLTGTESPRMAINSAVTVWTNSGASGGTTGGSL